MKTAIGIFCALLFVVILIPTGGSSGVITFIEIACVIAALGGIAYEFLKGPK